MACIVQDRLEERRTTRSIRTWQHPWGRRGDVAECASPLGVCVLCRTQSRGVLSELPTMGLSKIDAYQFSEC